MTTMVRSAVPTLPTHRVCTGTLAWRHARLLSLALLRGSSCSPPPPRYDFRQNLDKILHNSEVKDYYTPQAFAREHYGDSNSGKRLLKFVRDNFLDKVHIPEGTTLLLT